MVFTSICDRINAYQVLSKAICIIKILFLLQGMTASDEMCNFDLEFKYSAKDGMVFPHSPL